jgi:hypothetical protein
MLGEPYIFNGRGIPTFTPKVHITIHSEYNPDNRRRNAPAHITWGSGYTDKVTIPLYRNYSGRLVIDIPKWKRTMRINSSKVGELESTQEYEEGIHLLGILNEVIMGR